MEPVLMPMPNHIRYIKGSYVFNTDDGLYAEPEVLALMPEICAHANRILNVCCTFNNNSGFRFRILNAETLNKMNESFKTAYNLDSLSSECYCIDCSNSGLTVYATAAIGFFYALQTLKQLTVARSKTSVSLKATRIFDYPAFSIRGIHLYIPALENFEEFKRFTDSLAALKYNRIYFETAGMEIKKHPEMNEAWEKFSADMNEHPEKPKLYQSTFKYQKDSIHVECCGGKTISQEDVRSLVDYCKSQFFQVIPEVQSLTHCHFLTLAHREIAERPNDPYPDTYCPSNDRSYELLFDVIDEVLDVFKPSILNIGHDEYYSIGICERCKGKDPAELFAMDVNRIRDYLHEKGVRTEMWADKFVNAHNDSGRGEGGAFKMIDSYEVSKIFEVRGATFPAIEKVNKDILMGNWFWGIYPHGFERFRQHGFECTYNNFFGAGVADFDHYSSIGPISGGTCSHWSWVQQENMARDGFFFNVIFSSYPFWTKSYNNSCYETVRDLTLKYAPYFYQNYNNITLPSLSLYGTDEISAVTRHEQRENYYLDTSFVEIRNFRHTHVEHKVDTFSSKISVYNVGQTFRTAVVNDTADSLVFTHNTDIKIGHKATDHGYIMEDFLIGKYVVEYTDGQTVQIPLYFGKEISYEDVKWGRTRVSATNFSTDIYFHQASHYARPRLVPESKKGCVTMYEYEWLNPRPDALIRTISFTANRLDTPFSVFIADILCVKDKGRNL